MSKQQPIIYLAQLEGTMLAKKREILRLKLENLKELPHDKKEFKRKRKEIIAEMNTLTFDIDGKVSECYKQNYQVVKHMLMMFVGMDFVTRLYDNAADMFRSVTVGIKRDELLDFVKLCREVANRANEVVRIIDEAGKDAMSMAYAGMEEGIGQTLLDELEKRVNAYGQTPEGRKYFYGDHIKENNNNKEKPQCKADIEQKIMQMSSNNTTAMLENMADIRKEQEHQMKGGNNDSI